MLSSLLTVSRLPTTEPRSRMGPLAVWKSTISSFIGMNEDINWNMEGKFKKVVLCWKGCLIIRYYTTISILMQCQRFKLVHVLALLSISPMHLDHCHGYFTSNNMIVQHLYLFGSNSASVI